MSDPNLPMNTHQMSQHFNVTPRTLRFYDEKELLFPKRKGQTRLFGAKDVERMKLIMRATRLGFSLEAIRSHMQDDPIQLVFPTALVKQTSSAVSAAALDAMANANSLMKIAASATGDTVALTPDPAPLHMEAAQ